MHWMQGLYRNLLLSYSTLTVELPNWLVQTYMQSLLCPVIESKGCFHKTLLYLHITLMETKSTNTHQVWMVFSRTICCGPRRCLKILLASHIFAWELPRYLNTWNKFSYFLRVLVYRSLGKDFYPYSYSPCMVDCILSLREFLIFQLKLSCKAGDPEESMISFAHGTNLDIHTCFE